MAIQKGRPWCRAMSNLPNPRSIAPRSASLREIYGLPEASQRQANRREVAASPGPGVERPDEIWRSIPWGTADRAGHGDACGQPDECIEGMGSTCDEDRRPRAETAGQTNPSCTREARKPCAS